MKKQFFISLSGAIFSLTLIALLSVSTFTVSAFSPLTPVGRLTLIGTLSLGTSLLFANLARYKILLKPFVTVVLLFFLLISIYVLSWATNPTAQGFISVIQLLLVFGYFSGLVFALRQGWLRVLLELMAGVAALFILLHVSAWLVLGTPRIFGSYFAHPNVLGGITLFLLFFPVISAVLARGKLVTFFWWTVIGLGGLLIYATTSRSAWLAVAAATVTYLLWRFLSRRAFGYHLYIVIIFVILSVVIIAYARLPDSPQAVQLNAIVLDYTDKNLLSGRDRFWADLIALIQQQPVFGYGAGALPENYLDLGFSAHNSYLQISLQVGMVGLTIFLLLLWQIWRLFRRQRSHPVVRVSGAFFVAVLVHQTFEVSLLQNNLTLGALQWLVIACGVAASLSRRSRQYAGVTERRHL